MADITIKIKLDSADLSGGLEEVKQKVSQAADAITESFSKSKKSLAEGFDTTPLKNWSNEARQAFQQFSTSAQQGFDRIVPTVERFAKFTRQKIAEAYDGSVAQNLVNAVGSALDSIAQKADRAFTWVKEAMNKAYDITPVQDIADEFSRVYNSIKDGLEPVVQSVKDKLMKIYDRTPARDFVEETSRVYNSIKDNVSDLAQSAKQKLGEIYDNSPLKPWVDGIAGAFNNVKTLASSLFSSIKQTLASGFDVKAFVAKAQEIGNSIKDAGGKIKEFGSGLTSSITTPLLDFGKSAFESALKMDTLKQRFITLTGSSEAASAELKKLRDLSRLPGLGFTQVAEASLNLRKAGIEAGAAESAIKGLGNALLAAGRGKEDLDELTNILGNMSSTGQISWQNLNKLSDLAPNLSGVWKKAFGGQDLTKVPVKDLLDTTIKGLNEIPPAATNAKEVLSKFENAKSEGLRALGEAILPLVTSALQTVTPYIHKLTDMFTNLSPEVKQVILVIAGIAIAIGPVITIVGTIVGVIGTLIGPIAAIGGAVMSFVGLLGAGGLAGVLGAAGALISGTILPALAGFAAAAAPVIVGIGAIVAVIAVVVAAAVGLYYAWQTNFGGIRDYTEQIWNAVKQIFDTVMNEIYALVGEVGGQIVGWWNENYPLIQQTVETVSNAIKTFVGNFLNAIHQFWERHGEQIMNVIRPLWEAVKTAVKAGIDFVLDTIKFVMQLINGDWDKAWNTFKDIVQKGIDAGKKILESLGSAAKSALLAVIKILVDTANDAAREALDLGKAIVDGIINALDAGWERVKAAAGRLASAIPDTLRSLWRSSSPSKLAEEIGGDFVDGLVLGFTNNTDSVEDAVKLLAERARIVAIETMPDIHEILHSTQGNPDNPATDNPATSQTRARIVETNNTVAQEVQQTTKETVKQVSEAEKKLSESFNNIFQSLLKGGPKAALKTAFGEIKKAFLDEVNKLVSGLAQSLAKFTLKGLFGGGKESAAGEGSGQNGGQGGNNTTPGGAIQNALGNSGIFGKLLGKIPGLGKLFGGGASAAANAGTQGAGTAASGGLSFAKLGAFFSNPWTAVAIGGAIAGFFILKAIFGDKSIKRLREAIQSTYAITVKDKNVLKQIKQIGEQQLGPGAASKRPGEVIKLEEAKELIRAHAEATGQKTDKLGASRADYANENSAVNRQIAPFGGFRELGGIVRAGMAYVVGEKRPELFIPQQNGFIQPNFAFAGAGYGGGNAGRGSGGGDGLLALALSQLQETMGRFEAKLQSLSPGHVLAMGADENPSVIPDNVLREADSNPGFSDKFLTKTGQKW